MPHTILYTWACGLELEHCRQSYLLLRYLLQYRYRYLGILPHQYAPSIPVTTLTTIIGNLHPCYHPNRLQRSRKWGGGHNHWVVLSPHIHLQVLGKEGAGLAIMQY